MALITVQQDLDLATMTRLDDALWEQPLVGSTSLLFIVGLTIGLSLLGAALWRGRTAPRWMCGALIFGASTHPFMPNTRPLASVCWWQPSASPEPAGHCSG